MGSFVECRLIVVFGGDREGRRKNANRKSWPKETRRKDKMDVTREREREKLDDNDDDDGDGDDGTSPVMGSDGGVFNAKHLCNIVKTTRNTRWYDWRCVIDQKKNNKYGLPSLENVCPRLRKGTVNY